MKKWLLFFFIFYLVNRCCSIVIPPVTLTGNKTAIEKQIIGEKTELEKDVWMISSARTTTVGFSEESEESVKKAKEKKLQNKHARLADDYIFTALNILETYQKELSELKADMVVGENKEGFLSILLDEELERPKELQKKIQEKYNPSLEDDLEKGQAYRKLKETVAQINKARKLLIKSYVARQKAANPKAKVDLKEIQKLQAQKMHEAALRGEWIQLSDGQWVRK